MDAATQILAEAFDIAPIDPSPEALALALSELGYVIKKVPKPRAAAPRRVVEVFAPNTGDPKVDAFMRAHHNPKYRPLPMPKAPGMKPLRPMTVSEQDAADRNFREAARIARADIDYGNMPAAEERLRELIALHRNPWVRVGAQRDNGTDVTVYESERHRGIQLHRRAERGGAFSSGVSTTYEVRVNGERHGEKHYAIKAAEDAADALVAAFN